MIYHRCDRCRKPRLLLARVLGDELLCVECWRKAGSPPPNPLDDKERAAAQERNELLIREKMLKAGGEQRYRVIAGKS